MVLVQSASLEPASLEPASLEPASLEPFLKRLFLKSFVWFWFNLFSKGCFIKVLSGFGPTFSQKVVSQKVVS